MAEHGLEREFVRFARYLGWPKPSAQLASAYVRLHADVAASTDALDRLLCTLASRLPGGAALADAYARRMAPYGTFRRKVVLTLAILESAAESHAAFDRAVPGSSLSTWLSLFWEGVRWGATTVLAVLIIAPLHLLFGRGSVRG